MLSVQLPRFETFVGNAVYGRPLVQSTGTGIYGVVVLERYTQPSEDDVIDFLQKSAKRLDMAYTTLDDSAVPDDLERTILNLPLRVRYDLIRGDDDLLRFIRGHTPAPYIARGEPNPRYVEVLYGLALDTQVPRGNPQISHKKQIENGNLRQSGLGAQWRLKLLVDGGLPDKSEIDILLKNYTYRSKSLCVDETHGYNPREMSVVLDAVYAGFSSPIFVDLIPDVSQALLKNLSLQPMRSVHDRARNGSFPTPQSTISDRGPSRIN